VSKRGYLTLLVFTFLLVSAAQFKAEAAPLGYPGSTWGEIRQEFPDNGDSDLTSQGWVRQGIDWAHFGNLRLNTYGTVRFKWDTEGLNYNNYVGPGIGVALETVSWRGYSGSFGVEYLWDDYYKSGDTRQTLAIFLTWYGSWNIKKK
jgi:hypothetical protein